MVNPTPRTERRTDAKGADPIAAASDPVNRARERLEQAIGKLETTARIRMASDRTIEALEKQIQHQAQDRVRLAEEIDGLNRTIRRLSSANAEVSRRIGTAIETIETVLTDAGPDKDS